MTIPTTPIVPGFTHGWLKTIVRKPVTDQDCLCPGCYYVATEESELCLRCALDGCTNQENRHG